MAYLRRWLHTFPRTTHGTSACLADWLTATHIAYGTSIASPCLGSPTQVCKLGLEERVWRTLHAEDGTVQPLRSREIKAAVASHTQFEHMKKEVSDHQASLSKPTEGLTFFASGCQQNYGSLRLPCHCLTLVIAHCFPPKSPQPQRRKTTQCKFFPELRAMRSAATHNGAVVATAARTGCWPAQTRRDKAPRRMRWRNDFTPYRAPACEQWSKLQGYCVACETAFLHAEKSS
jgi:hypothetical protein